LNKNIALFCNRSVAIIGSIRGTRHRGNPAVTDELSKTDEIERILIVGSSVSSKYGGSIIASLHSSVTRAACQINIAHNESIYIYVFNS
jgi:hypothetical protein